MSKKKKTEQPTAKPFIIKRTLEEEDAHDLEMLTAGADDERTTILRALYYRHRQLVELSELVDKPGRGDKFAEYARGVELAYNIVANLPKYDEEGHGRVGCFECGAI